MVVGIGAFSGNVIGGELINANLFGWLWRPIFLVNLPVGLAALVGTAFKVRESRAPLARKLDPGGVVLATAALFLLLFPLVEGREAGWPPWAFFSLAAAGPMIAFFIWFERRCTTAAGRPSLSWPCSRIARSSSAWAAAC